ncbi:MAG: hypothetical protein VX712_03865 [Bacteroidota bacterium]|nr:hypothetical protein [Bacteroidota bacterium]
MRETSNKYLIAALLIGVIFHSATIIFTLEQTYDALIHLFFAEHYASNWFEPWNYKWYTGFTVMGYPPLVHQCIALLSYIGGLKFGLFTAILAVILFISGVYRFSLLFSGNRKVAGYASLLAVFSSSFIETLHIFGQLPSIVGISLLLHALPEIYLYIKNGRKIVLFRAISLIAVTVTSHHVTPIFGMIFFIFPLIGMVIMDRAKEVTGTYKFISIRLFLNVFRKLFARIVLFGMSALGTIIFCILPYWINTRNNPITQVPIPHGSRDNFLEVTSSGLVFFLIPWGLLLLFIPYFFYRFYSRRYLFFGLSFTMLLVLGTGGTTPLPRILLGENAFNILTLDRFTLWASIMALPLFGEFAYRFSEADLKTFIQQRFGSVYHRVLGALLVGSFLSISVFSISLGHFRPMQPQAIKMLPIINFLNQDQHDHWRFLTLGFGDQMAWLSAQTTALSVDGNYHSARRLPELTSRAVERPENSKYRGVEGLGSLQQFVTVPEKYHLKYIFSNDKFYEPLLYFSGWQRLQQLENGIMVWERMNVPPMPKILTREDLPVILKLMWGITPVFTILLAFFLNLQLLWYHSLKTGNPRRPDFLNFGRIYPKFNGKLFRMVQLWWGLMLFLVLLMGYFVYVHNTAQLSAENVTKAYYDAIDFKEFERAHSYINPEDHKSLAQFMLEVSVTDGLLSSYAKLDSLAVRIRPVSENEAMASVYSSWITPLKKIEKHREHHLVKIGRSWFISADELDPDLPPDQLFSQNQTAYFNHGRRKISTQQTYHEDVLKQPLLQVLSARLVKKGTHFSIVGEIQNIDQVPADVTIQASLYDEQHLELASYNAGKVMKHKLMPKEVTSFRVDFERIAWVGKNENLPETFNPDEFAAITFNRNPVSFQLRCSGNVATKDLYKSVVLQKLEQDRQTLSGELFNYGIQEVTIPQLLLSYYDARQNLLWVEEKFVDDGVRVQRKQGFQLELPKLQEIKLVTNSMQQVYVNGLPNTEIAKRYPNFQNLAQLPLQELENGIFLKIELNNYIGNTP